MKKTLLIGSFGAKNLGDELILQAALKKNAHVLIMTANSNFSLNFSNKSFKTIQPFPTGFKSFLKFLFAPKRWKDCFDLQKQIKKIIFPGGGLFSKSNKAIAIWTLNVFWVLFFLPGKKIFFQAQGIDIPNNTFFKKLVLWSFNQAEKVSVRDENSKKNLQILGYKKNITVVKDTAAEYLEKKIKINAKKTEKKRILIQATNKFNEELLRDKISKKFVDYSIKFIAFDFLDIENMTLNTSVPTNKILFPTDEADLLREFEDASVFIGQRFHFLVLAHLFGGFEKTFLLEKPYAPKTKILAENLDLKIF